MLSSPGAIFVYPRCLACHLVCWAWFRVFRKGTVGCSENCCVVLVGKAPSKMQPKLVAMSWRLSSQDAYGRLEDILVAMLGS